MSEYHALRLITEDRQMILSIADSLERRAKELYPDGKKPGMDAIELAISGSARLALSHMAAAIREHIAKCPTCSKPYNPAWGRMCPNCSGAD